MAKSLQQQLDEVEAAITSAVQGDYRIGSRYAGRQQILAPLFAERARLQDLIDRNGGLGVKVVQVERPT